MKLRRKEPVKLAGALLVIERADQILLRQRDADARRMAGFWDLPEPAELTHARLGAELGAIRHTITHHHYTLQVYRATLTRVKLEGAFRWFTRNQLHAIPLSTTARKALKLAGVL